MGTQNSLYADLSTWNPYALYSSTNVPPLLHTCHESRVEGLKYCDLDFGSTFKFENSGTDKKFPNMEITLPPQIYINWIVDRICIMRPEDFHPSARMNDSPDGQRISNFLDRCDEMHLKYLAINVVQKRMPYLDMFDSDGGWSDSDEDEDDGSWPPFTSLIPRGGYLKELALFSDERWRGPSHFNMRSRSVPGKIFMEEIEHCAPGWAPLAAAFDCFLNENEEVAFDTDEPDAFFERVLDLLDVLFCSLKFKSN